MFSREFYSPQEVAYLEFMLSAWKYGCEGDINNALADYLSAKKLGLGDVAPESQLTRFREGVAVGGIVRAVEPTEDSVVVLEMQDEMPEFELYKSTKATMINRNRMIRNIKRYQYQVRKHHVDNIHTEMPHVMVLSTGRCGTVSMYHLFNQANYVPHHTFTYNPPARDRMEMMCRMMAVDDGASMVTGMGAENWAMMRSAEWLSAMESGQRYIGLNHMDTIYAPLFATIHPQARFIHLTRDPVDVYESFYTKNQWNESQLQPLFYNLDPFSYSPQQLLSEVDKIAWFIKFTNEFCTAMTQVLGPRCIEISADLLFAGDEEETQKLLDYTELDITLDEALEHYTQPINKKSHKARRLPDYDAFDTAYGGVR